MLKNKKFISIIWGYHEQIFLFDKKQNYHMLPLEVMKENGYECEIFSLDSKVKIEEDPNYINGVKVVYYKNFFDYINYLFKNKNVIIYSNSLTIKTLLVGVIGKKTIFYPHAFLFGGNVFKKTIVKFFYKFYNKIRVNNKDEEREINKIRNNLAYRLPLSVSDKFLNEDFSNRSNGVWIGNLTEAKNPMQLIDTFKLIKQDGISFKLKIIGEDKYNLNGKNFSDIIIENGLEDYIELLGVKNNEEIKDELKNKLIYINTSKSEGQCLGVYEGALSGCFLCIPDIISFPSVFGKNALYHKNSEELYQNILKTINMSKKELIEKISSIQKMILKSYNYAFIKQETKKMFLGLN